MEAAKRTDNHNLLEVTEDNGKARREMASRFYRGAFDSPPPLSVGGLDLNSSSSGFARLGSGVAPPLSGWLKKKWPS